MPKLIKMPKVNLQLFNDGGAVGGEGSGGATEGASKVEVTKPSGSNRRSKSGEFDNVIFGKQEGTTSTETTTTPATEGNATDAGEPEVKTTSNTLEDKRRAYEELINGEYKDIHQEKFQEVFNRRFKEVKGLENNLAAQKPIIDMMMSRYGITDGDVGKLEKALTEDTEYWEKVADDHGMTVDGYMKMQRMEMENAELRAVRQREVDQARFQSQIDNWYREAESVKSNYPSFDFKTEVQNPEFIKLLKSGVGVEHAYKMMHFDELTENAARVAAQTADAQATARIKSKSSRPSENGTSSQSAAIVRSDVSTLTRKERAEIARRVARGEEIKF